MPIPNRENCLDAGIRGLAVTGLPFVATQALQARA